VLQRLQWFYNDNIRVSQRCFATFTRTLQGCYKDVTRMLQGSDKDVTRVLQGQTFSFLLPLCEDVTMIKQGCYKGVPRMLHGRYKRVTRVLQECYKNLKKITLLRGCCFDVI
jgi:hypothetical protein